MFIKVYKEKQILVYLQSEIVSNYEENITDTYTSFDESQKHYVQWRKVDIKVRNCIILRKV